MAGTSLTCRAESQNCSQRASCTNNKLLLYAFVCAFIYTVFMLMNVCVYSFYADERMCSFFCWWTHVQFLFWWTNICTVFMLMNKYIYLCWWTVFMLINNAELYVQTNVCTVFMLMNKRMYSFYAEQTYVQFLCWTNVCTVFMLNKRVYSFYAD